MSPLDKLTEALDIESMSPEEQEKTLLDLNALIFRGSIMRMIAQMDEPIREAFGKLVESNASEEQLQAFLTENVPQADQAVKDTVDVLTSDILAVTNNQ